MFIDKILYTFPDILSSYLRSLYLGPHQESSVAWREALCDDPNNDCVGDYTLNIFFDCLRGGVVGAQVSFHEPLPVSTHLIT